MLALAVLAGPANADPATRGSGHNVSPAGFNWTGWYAGVDVGYLNSKTLTTYDGGGFGRPDPDGWLGGVHIGYRWQLPSRLVLGVEADIWGGDLFGEQHLNFANTTQLKVNHGGSIRGVLGVAMSPTLLYLTGGAAAINVDGCFAVAFRGPCTDAQNSATRWGWTAGAGIAHAYANGLIARLEYLYADYGHETYPTPTLMGIWARSDIQTHIFRAGLSWRFSTR